jgi:CheY-like chemotaxis protein
LVVDDDDGVRTTAQVMLEGLGAEVVATESGRSALAILQTDRRFDLLIIDFAMPQMNGGELATEIDTFWPDAPMLFVTGYVENDVLRPWRDRGIPTLNKPYGQSELVNAIERALNVAAAGAPAVSERA